MSACIHGPRAERTKDGHDCRLCRNEKMRVYRKNNREAHLRDQKKSHRSLPVMFNRAKYSAKERGIVWNISYELFVLIRSKICHYCEGKLPEVGSGIDRIENSRGYEPDNVLPCCGDCNKHRHSTWTVGEMVAAARAVKEYRALNLSGPSESRGRARDEGGPGIHFEAASC